LAYVLLLTVWVFIQIFLKRFFLQEFVSAVQGHPRSLISVPIESAYATYG